MTEYVCEQCGERNAYGTTFCVSCGAFLAWDEAERSGLDAGHGIRGAAVATVIRRPIQTAEPGAGLFRVAADVTALTVAATGEPSTLEVRIANTSEIVEGYLVAAPEAPSWLLVESSEVRLLPGTEQTLAVRLRVAPATMVPAQQLPVRLRLRPVSQTTAYVDVSVLVTVPVLTASVGLRAEPRLLRIRDRTSATCVLLVNNSGSNQPVQVRFAGSDPELAATFTFEPEVLVLGPGAAGSARLTVSAPAPEPGQELTRVLTVTGTTRGRAAETTITLHQLTTVRTEDPPVILEAEPSLLRVHDATLGQLRILVDNRGGREWAHLRFKAGDPERIVRVTWAQDVVHVPPGRIAYADARLEAPLPGPGAEVSRTVTVSATDGRRTSTTTATLVQTASRSAMELLAVRLDPTVVRLRNRRRATFRVTLDNRQGAQPLQLRLHGDDPENALRFTFEPAGLVLAPGAVASAAATVYAPRTPPGPEVTRPFTIVAADAWSQAQTGGSIIASASSRRPLARALFTLLGALAMVVGSFQTWFDSSSRRGVDLDAGRIARDFNADLDLDGFERLLSAGLFISALAVLVLFGLAGASGRLSRGAAVSGVLILVALFVALGVVGVDVAPDPGAFLVLGGCVAGYIGGTLRPRRS